jgi:hypothetical protein
MQGLPSLNFNAGDITRGVSAGIRGAESKTRRKLMDERNTREQENQDAGQAGIKAQRMISILKAGTPEESAILNSVYFPGTRMKWLGENVEIQNADGTTITGPKAHLVTMQKMQVAGADPKDAYQYAVDNGVLISNPQQEAEAQFKNLDAAYTDAVVSGDKEKADYYLKALGELNAFTKKQGSESQYFTPVQTSQGLLSFNNREGTAEPLVAPSGENYISPPADPTLIGQKETAKADAKLQIEKKKKFPKIRSTMTSAKRQWSLVDSKIEDALKLVGPFTSGVGAWARIIPATPQKNLSEILGTIKANIGFDKLQDMRNNSPTGGALGQVSEFENKLLQAVQGSLDQSQSPAELKKNLEQIRDNLAGLRKEQEKSFAYDFADFIEPEKENGTSIKTAEDYLKKFEAQ